MNEFQANIAMAFPHSFIFPPNEDHSNDHLFSPSCPPQLFLGVEQVLVEDESSDDDGSHVGEKKKRLKLEQVKALEKSFESGNKLEPQRKLQLAKALGLKPRQVAIWFQNRRARWKTKLLEKDYDVLKKQCEALKADADALQAQNKKLSAELLSLKTKDSNEISIKDEVNEGSWSRKSLFSTSSTRPTSMVQLLQGSTRPDLPCTKPDQVVQVEGFCTKPDQVVQVEGFCYLLNEVDEQQGFWPWGEQ
ncbi:hypothetical protein PVK06_010944 [Gossypium arboreum]|uniref:Homeobox-leucine zipper protein n=1 Tax=Gossypium arboreum TaxID=29729 RepID=A0ABR0Q7P6_GOSAR|nr:hypothetical protein PVK06_010944 [Gossypium arboreum]